MFFQILPLQVDCSSQGELFPISKLPCLVLFYIIFLPELPSKTVYSLLIHLDLWERISSLIQDLFFSHKLIIEAQLVFKVDCTGEGFAFASTHHFT